MKVRVKNDGTLLHEITTSFSLQLAKDSSHNKLSFVMSNVTFGAPLIVSTP